MIRVQLIQKFKNKQTRCSAIISSQVDDLNFYFVVGNKSQLSVVYSPFSVCYSRLLCQVCEIIESPLFLKLNPMTKHTDVSFMHFFCFKNEKIP